MALKHQAPRGTRDLLPDELDRWQWAEERARDVLEHYAYREIRTPIFEDYELFARTSGESSEVVQKEMYRFQDLKGRSLALRPEGTASVCRAYLEHSMSGRERVHKLWYMGPMFRYGRPQKGRYRQFSQIGAEIVGAATPAADVEMISLFVDIFAAWGFEDLVVAVNSVGTPETRRAYGDSLREWLAPVRDQLSGDSQQRLAVNPMRVLDTKDPGDLRLLKGEWGDEKPATPLPRMIDSLDADANTHWEAVLKGLTELGLRLPTMIASSSLRSSCTRCRAASPVTQRESPVRVAILPSSDIPHFATTKGVFVVMYLMKTSLSRFASASITPTSSSPPASW